MTPSISISSTGSTTPTSGPLRACEPRDLMLRCADHCKYENLPKSLSNDIILLAWKNYFGAAPTIQ